MLSPVRVVPNKANCPKRGTEAVSRLRITDCGLRSQPGMTALRIGHRPATGRPSRPARPGASCTNKPNWPERTVRNKANSPGGELVGQAPPYRSAQLRQTNPICARGADRTRYKQSQFGTSRARACPELAEGTPNLRRDDCAKQTQFPILGSPTQNSVLGSPFRPMNHRQDADATTVCRPHPRVGVQSADG